jgi:hypothetical protein
MGKWTLLLKRKKESSPEQLSCLTGLHSSFANKSNWEEKAKVLPPADSP